MIRYEFDNKMPSLNELLAASHKGKNSRYFHDNTMKKQIQEDLFWQMKAQGLKHVKKGPVDIHITWYEGRKNRDKDNVISSQKMILDALVNARVLGNDNWDWVNQITPRVYASSDKKYRVVVEIIEPQDIK